MNMVSFVFSILLYFGEYNSLVASDFLTFALNKYCEQLKQKSIVNRMYFVHIGQEKVQAHRIQS
jgi:hypothetical protein